MTQPKRRDSLGEDELSILRVLREAADDGQGNLHLREVQRTSGVLFIRTPLDRLKRCGFVDHDGTRALVDRFWRITAAGREAIS